MLLLNMNNEKTKKTPLIQQPNNFLISRIKKYFYSLKIYKK